MNADQERFFRRHDLSELLLVPPKRLVRPYAWVGHLPFARVLVRLMRPRVLVELGTHTGNSFSGFCQAVRAEGLRTRCIAVDTWQGDPQAGFYDDAVFTEFSAFVETNFRAEAHLARSTFDDAAKNLRDGLIDLLHIDGLHTYEAVRHDFETWKSKLSARGVVLFHDTSVLDRDFGVHRLWKELRAQHPGFEFRHSHGLGVLLVGNRVPAPVRELVELMNADPAPAQTLFERAALLGLPEAAFAYQREFGSAPPAENSGSLDCELFLDCGGDFNEREKLISSVDLTEGRGSVRFELRNFSKDLTRLRFDPGHHGIALKNVTARVRTLDGGWHDLGYAAHSAVLVDEDVLMFADDPWVEFVLPAERTDTCEVSLEVVARGDALSRRWADVYRRMTEEKAEDPPLSFDQAAEGALADPAVPRESY